ncbi:MAG: tRNA (adenosine(37)-N6)-threonylcarbamoyltransferase complex dimerization subunit type 1 TsaB [Anaerolineae bacterium]
MLLAIDTATQTMSLAIFDGRAILAEQSWPTANNHSIQLGPTVQNLLAHCDITVKDLTALAVCTGPGSYSGLRVGVAFAKGLASVHRLPLVGIGSLDIIAAAQLHYSDGLIVLVQVGRGRVVVGRYQWRKNHWINRGEAQIMDWDTLMASIDGSAHITGEVNEIGHEAIVRAQASGVPVTLVPAANRLRRAGFLAEEAWNRIHERQEFFDASKVLPFYVKTLDVPET